MTPGLCYLCCQRVNTLLAVFEFNDLGQLVPVCHVCLSEALSPSPPFAIPPSPSPGERVVSKMESVNRKINAD